MQEKGNIGVLLGAAKVSDELVPVFGSVPSTLIPINGKPVLFFLLEYFRFLGIQEVYVSVGYLREKVQAILDAYADDDSFRVISVEVDPSKRPGSALLDVIKTIPEEKRRTHGLYIQLADTLFSQWNSLPFDRNIVAVSREYARPERWCVVDRSPNDKRITAIHDKQKGQEGKFAAIGAYYFCDATSWDDMNEQECEISSLLNHVLNKGIPIEAYEKSGWFDLGHLETYYQAKARSLSPRAFNELHAGEFMNTVRKQSSKNEILKDEILWYLNLPKDLQIHAPRIIDHNIEEEKGEVYAEFEFYGYPSLANLWLYGDFSLHIWEAMIDRVFSILQRFRRTPHGTKLKDSIAMYAEKTNARVEQAIRQHKVLVNLFSAESVLINGEKYKGWPSFQGRLERFAKWLYNREDHCFLHGDMCFSNILFDLNYGVVKLVDPRGRWGSERFYGDIKYDVAKLRHSSAGFYDHIVQGHVHVEYSVAREHSIRLDFPLVNELHMAVKEYVDRKIASVWDLNKIKLIEGLLFISMIPLHAENEKRQIAMFARGIQLLNEVEEHLPCGYVKRREFEIFPGS